MIKYNEQRTANLKSDIRHDFYMTRLPLRLGGHWARVVPS